MEPALTNRTYLGLRGHRLWILSRLERRVFNTADRDLRSLLTIHKLPHILDESVDNSERMSCGSTGLVMRQSVKPLQHCLDVLLLENFLHEFDCVVLSRVKHRQERTHLIVAA